MGGQYTKSGIVNDGLTLYLGRPNLKFILIIPLIFLAVGNFLLKQL
jgi:hypothetical protein